MSAALDRQIVAKCGKCKLTYSSDDVDTMEPIAGGRTMPSGDDGYDLRLYNCNAPGCGSTFSVRVPVAPSAEQLLREMHARVAL